MRTRGTRPKGSGPGWGGPAKGAGNGKHAPRITVENAREMGARKDTPESRAKAHETRLRKEEFLEILAEIARHGDAEANRMNAADKVLDRLIGKPKQALDMTTDGKPMGYFSGPPVAKTMEEWEEWAKADAESRKNEAG